jgi:hypothetical protein
MLWIKDKSKILKRVNVHKANNKGEIHYLRRILCKDNTIKNKMKHSLKRFEIGEPFNFYKLKKVKYQIYANYSWKHVKLVDSMTLNAIASNPFLLN